MMQRKVKKEKSHEEMAKKRKCWKKKRTCIKKKSKRMKVIIY